MELLGVFAPPAMGRTEMPIPLVGPGKLVLAEEGLQASGYRRKGGMSSGVMALLIICCILLVPVGAATIELPRGAILAVVMVLVAAISIVANRNRGKAGKTAPPWSFTVPWTSVTDAMEDPSVRGAILIRVRDFKPSGTLHFQPPEGTSILELVSAVKRRAETARSPIIR